MINSSSENENFRISRQITQKFEFYFLALVFTVLGLAIQTSSFSTYYCQYVFELFAWISLLLSGLAGLSRLEWATVAYRHYGEIANKEQELKTIKEGLTGRPILCSSGEQWTKEGLTKEKSNLEGYIGKHKERAITVERWIQIKYVIHKWGFVVGVISLGVARGILGIGKMLSIVK